MHRIDRTTVAILGVLVCLPTLAGLDVPQPVSPGDARFEVTVASNCPTFSWTAVDRARGYELRIVPVGQGRASAIEISIAGTATSWTPSLDQCLQAGTDYTWSVREADPYGAYRGTWSPVHRFSTSVSAAQGNDATNEGKGNGKGNAGIPAVLDELQRMQQRMLALQEQIAANQRSTDMRFDAVEATQADHSDVLSRVRTYRAADQRALASNALLFVQGQLCMKIEGGINAEGTTRLKGLVKALGHLGIKVYGPGAGGEGEARAEGVAELKAGGAAKVELSVCVGGPGLRFIDLSDGVDDPQRLLSQALANGEDVLANVLADEAASLGLDLANLGNNLEQGVRSLKALRLPENPFELLDPTSAIRQDIKNVVDLVPLPPELRERLMAIEDLAPRSLSEINVCSSDFKYPLPPGTPLDDIRTRTCEFGTQALDLVGLKPGASLEDLAQAGIDRIEDLLNLRDQLLTALDTLGRIADKVDAVSDPGGTVSDRICNQLPPRGRPPFCP